MRIVREVFENYIGTAPKSKGFDKTAHVVVTRDSIFVTENYSLYKAITSHFRSNIIVSLPEATKKQLEGLRTVGYKHCVCTKSPATKTIVISKNTEEFKKFIKPIVSLHIKENNIKFDKANPKQRCARLSLDIYGNNEQLDMSRNYGEKTFSCDRVNEVLEAEKDITSKIDSLDKRK